MFVWVYTISYKGWDFNDNLKLFNHNLKLFNDNLKLFNDNLKLFNDNLKLLIKLSKGIWGFAWNTV